MLHWDPDTDLGSLIDGEAEALGVAGGDGTVASVAQIAHQRGLPLAVFPAGTLNHFAKALGLDTDAHTVAAVEAGVAGRVDMAFIDGVGFLNTAIIGGYPEMVRRRDRYSHQYGKWPATAYAIVRTLRHEKPLELVINGEQMPVWVVFIGNGRYIPRGLAPSWREQLAGGVLDVQYLRADRRLSRTRAVLYSLVGLVDRSHVFGSLESAKVTHRVAVRTAGDRARRRDHRPHRHCQAGDLRPAADGLPRDGLSTWPESVSRDRRCRGGSEPQWRASVPNLGGGRITAAGRMAR